MNFRQMQTGLDVFGPHAINAEVDGIYLSGAIEAEHDQIWLSLHRRPTPEFTPDETARLTNAGWFWDGENGAWSHFA